MDPSFESNSAPALRLPTSNAVLFCIRKFAPQCVDLPCMAMPAALLETYVSRYNDRTYGLRTQAALLLQLSPCSQPIVKAKLNFLECR